VEVPKRADVSCMKCSSLGSIDSSDEDASGRDNDVMYELVDYDKTPHLVKHCDLSDILRCLSLSEEKTDCGRIFFRR